jgi:hypothetical protein
MMHQVEKYEYNKKGKAEIIDEIFFAIEKDIFIKGNLWLCIEYPRKTTGKQKQQNKMTLVKNNKYNEQFK